MTSPVRALVAIALVLSAVFLPMAFFGGSTGVIYRQFSVTVIADSATEAEILAKAAFLGAEVDVPRVLVTADGRTILAGGLA